VSHSIESFLDPATCEAVIGAVNDFVDRAYTPERCRLRQAYVYEYRLGMEAFAFAVHCPGSQETRHLPGFGLEELPQPLPRIFREVCARMGLSRGRVLFNVARYPEDSPPVAAHFDGELFEFELRPDGGGSYVRSGLRPAEVALVTLRNETAACGTTLHGPDGRVIQTRARVGELLRFDNLEYRHGVPATGRRAGGASSNRPRWIRYTIGWRALEQDCADWHDGRPLRPVALREAVEIEERFLAETWPRLVDETVARGHFPFRSPCS